MFLILHPDPGRLYPPSPSAPGARSRGAGISVVGDWSDMGVPGVPTSVTWRFEFS